ncbi:tripartite tricarboxylate transporter TctB family protein [Pseudonocardia sp. DR1-2]|uniref:tripartite tricarboxylate transporter TctB family protein n=1 Tax=Pseudonocardia sp. DR1-2 TaxID=2951168 RepID=UPI0020433C94|nr:tripartite tricarboxylate transporter TctB family protein [Pseudonocardia sp. DR1-2]MCM3847883.1 tripartite tricarboxylate transporter TctB family protein [Pseudonocardia sp. DR1-2]
MSGRPAHLSRGALVVPAILAALGVFLTYGTLTMQVVGDGGLFGPTTMPWIVAILCYVVAALLAFDILRPRPEFDAPAPAAAGTGDGTAGGDTPADTGVNAPAVLTAVGGVAAFIVVLPYLGWILSATGLFVAVAAALGNRRWPAMALGGLAVSSAVQVVFSMLLGISLPAGFVGGL